MDDPRALEKLVRLEERVRFDRELNDYKHDGLERRVVKLEATSGVIQHAMNLAGWFKILAGIALPLLVLLATGDLRQAIAALRGG